MDVLRAAAAREPVWGALDGNPASAGLARRLGLRPLTRFVVVSPAGA